MVDSAGVFVGLKLPWCERLPVGVQARLATLAKEWEGLVDHIPRGGRKASVSVKFFGGGAEARHRQRCRDASHTQACQL